MSSAIVPVKEKRPRIERGLRVRGGATVCSAHKKVWGMQLGVGGVVRLGTVSGRKYRGKVPVFFRATFCLVLSLDVYYRRNFFYALP